MEFIAGLATALVFFIAYDRIKKRKTPELSEIEKQKIEQQKREWEEIFAYNLDKAIRGGGRD